MVHPLVTSSTTLCDTSMQPLRYRWERLFWVIKRLSKKPRNGNEKSKLQQLELFTSNYEQRCKFLTSQMMLTFNFEDLELNEKLKMKSTSFVVASTHILVHSYLCVVSLTHLMDP